MIGIFQLVGIAAESIPRIPISDRVASLANVVDGDKSN